jgi:hypothetical protein
MNYVSRAIDAVIATVVVRTFPWHDLNGIRVVFTDLLIEREDGLARLRNAIALLGESDPRRYRQLQRYCRTIIVWGGHYTTANAPYGIRLGRPHLMETSALELASTLVHEVTHLRIFRYGIHPAKSLIGRMERRCIAEQSAFLRRNGPEGEIMATIIEEELDQNPWWTKDANHRDVERLVTDTRLPRWVIPLMKGARKLIG